MASGDEPVNPTQRAGLLEVLREAQRRGFLGPGPLTEQLDHALAFLGVIPVEVGSEGLDLGSGGGLPALPLAVARPDVRWTLVDAMAKRTEFLVEAVATLELEQRVAIVTSRAEVLSPSWRGRFDLVTARGFGRPAVLAECASPWLRIGGVLVVSEPPGGDPDRWPAERVGEVGLELDLAVVGPPSFVRLRQTALCPSAFPRRIGIPAKRPLW
jgi:16S rRNA (guanine527-N7)-methyltransferase